jgi:hypothetical protein
MSDVIKTEFGTFTVEDIKALYNTDAGKQVRASLTVERKAERAKKAEAAKEKAAAAIQHVAELVSQANVEIPDTIYIKKVGVTNKTDTYKDVYINFRIGDFDTPHTLTIPVSGETDTEEKKSDFEKSIFDAKIHLITLVSELS